MIEILCRLLNHLPWFDLANHRLYIQLIQCKIISTCKGFKVFQYLISIQHLWPCAKKAAYQFKVLSPCKASADLAKLCFYFCEDFSQFINLCDTSQHGYINYLPHIFTCQKQSLRLLVWPLLVLTVIGNKVFLKFDCSSHECTTQALHYCSFYFRD